MGKSDNLFSLFTAESKFYSTWFPNSWPAVVFCVCSVLCWHCKYCMCFRGEHQKMDWVFFKSTFCCHVSIPNALCVSKTCAAILHDWDQKCYKTMGVNSGEGKSRNFPSVMLHTGVKQHRQNMLKPQTTVVSAELGVEQLHGSSMHHRCHAKHLWFLPAGQEPEHALSAGHLRVAAATPGGITFSFSSHLTASILFWCSAVSRTDVLPFSVATEAFSCEPLICSCNSNE